MTRRSPGRFSEPTAVRGSWLDERATFFWHDGLPLDVKFEIEKITGLLLTRDPDDADQLSYASAPTGVSEGHQVRLRLEAVVDACQAYALTVRSSAPRRWTSEDQFRLKAERRFEYLCSKLQRPCKAIDRSGASAAQLADVRRTSIALEAARALVVEDPAPVARLQQAVLAAMRNGAVFLTAHKEGGTRLGFDGRNFRRIDYGDQPNVNHVFADDAAMLACLRAFFDWDSRQQDYPHRPPEVEVWRYIQGQLRQRPG